MNRFVRTLEPCSATDCPNRGASVTSRVKIAVVASLGHTVRRGNRTYHVSCLTRHPEWAN